MTNPLIPDPGQPAPDDSHSDIEFPVHDHSDDAENDSTRYIVKSPWYIDSLSGGDAFPEVTPHGVEMSGAERQKAYEAARESGITLKSKEV